MPTPLPSPAAAEFLERARREAGRYGSDPWVFVRELLQNARDAGARTVTVTVRETEASTRVSFADDGSGMTFDHARRYLFALYASSKERERGAAGRFGVGFWSVLRFEPDRILVRSWPRRGAGWEIELDGGLTRTAMRPLPKDRAHGVEVILERAQGDGQTARRVRDAAWQSGRYACRREDPSQPLEIRVNGERISEELDLPRPSLRFRKGRVRGAVGLGPEARVELLAQGLRVRAASTLEDLLSADGSSSRTRVRFPVLADGIAPQAVLDGEDFEPLLARSDVRDTRALRRVVAVAQDELRRLVERQVDALRPPPFRERLTRVAALVVAGGALVAAGVALVRYLPSRLPASPAPVVGFGDPTRPGASVAAVSAAAYQDLGGYGGPQVDALPSTVGTLALHYTPADAPHHFAGLTLDRPLAPAPPLTDAGAYAGLRCLQACVEVALGIDDGPGTLRLLVPTGHRVDPTSVQVEGAAIALRNTTAGEPYVVLDRRVQGIIRYRTGPAREPARRDVVPPELPAELEAEAQRLRRVDASARVDAATEWVSRRVRYSTSEETAARHRAAGQADLLAAALAIGEADCDVQNAVLTVLLQASGMEARLAIGYVGREGGAAALSHAWVEVKEGDGRWRAADASVPFVSGSTPADLGPVSVWSPPASEITEAATAPTAAAPLPVTDIDPRWWLAGPALLLAGVALLRRRRRIVRLAPDQDVAVLVQGALQRPEAFREVPSLYRRRLLPLLDGRHASLAEAWDRTQTRRLFRSAGRSDLARQVAKDGGWVLDTRRLEARAAADALGAVDLDEWGAFLGRSRKSALLAAVDRAVGSLGESWDVRAVTGLAEPGLLDLPDGTGPRRVVALGAETPWLLAAEGLHASRPHEATLLVVDRLAVLLGLPATDRARLLPPLARATLREESAC